MSGLDLETEKKIKEVFSSFDEIDKVILYGSRAKGNYKIGSDIDLTLYGKNLKLQIIYKIQDKLDELYVPYKFDLSIYAHLDNLELKESIDNSGVVFYQKKYGLPKGWEIKKLGEVCEKITDGSHNPPKGVVSSDFMMLSSKNIFDDLINYEDPRYLPEKDFELENKRTQVKKNDVLLTIVGTIGRVAVVPDNHYKFTLQRSVAVLKVDENVLDSRFLMFSLQNILKFLTAEARGVAQKGIYLNQLKEIQIPLPPLKEQQRIVSILDECFSVISVAKANAQQNLKNAKELFESYLQGIFENKGEDWEVRRLGESNLIEIIDGDRGKNYPTQKDFLDKGYCLFMNTKNVRPNGFEFNTTMFINEEKDNSMGKGKLKRNDVVMTTRGTIGNLGVYDDDVEYDNIRINSGMLIFRPNLKQITSEYFFEILRSGIIKEQIKKHVTGAAQPQLPIKTLVNFIFPVPKSIKEQQTIVHKLDALSAETKRLEAIYQQKINDLEELKKSILQKAFSGCLLARV